jgi:hypothetical protein
MQLRAAYSQESVVSLNVSLVHDFLNERLRCEHVALLRHALEADNLARVDARFDCKHKCTQNPSQSMDRAK